MVFALLCLGPGIKIARRNINRLKHADDTTLMYYDDFENAWMQNTMLGAMGDFKVLNCDGETAEVYYIAKDHYSGDVLRFEMQEGKWIETGWSTVWSDTGSASDVIWPYWWHFIYGGF